MASQPILSMLDAEPLVDDKSKPRRTTLDDYVHLSWYCFRVLLFAEFVLLSVMGNMVYMVYAGAAPRRVSCLQDDAYIENICKMNISHRELTNCTYETEYEFRSVQIDFEYFCGDSSYVKSSISAQMLGVLVGALCFGHLSDKYGRKKVLMYCFLLCIVFQVATVFARTLWMFTVLRAIVGFFNGGQMTIYSVYKIEHTPKNHRVWITALISFAPNFILMNGIAWLSHDWQSFQIALVIVSFPALLISFFLYESPRWLLGRGRIAEAEHILLNIQRIDGKTEHREELTSLLQAEFEKAEAREKKQQNYSIIDLFSTQKMAAVTSTLCMGMLFTSMINYGLMFNLEKLYKKCGRKLFHFIAQASSCFCLCVVAAVHLLGMSHEWSMFIRVATIVATAVCSQVYLSKGIAAMEYFPSVIRNIGISFNSTLSRLGTILAPQMFIYFTWKPLPFIIMAVMAALDAISFQAVIPETKGRAMQDTMPEKAEKRSETS
ncbi:unnamed protein product, partial [Mesorhabditis spiculigera]